MSQKPRRREGKATSLKKLGLWKKAVKAGRKLSASTSKALKTRSEKCLRRQRLNPILRKFSNIKTKRQQVARFRLQMYLTRLVKLEQDRIVRAIRQSGMTPDAEMRCHNIDAIAQNWLSKLGSFFAALEEVEHIPTVPGYICDPISSNILEDPVVIQSGVTYEREFIEGHLRAGGKDPLTSEEVAPDLIIPNLSIRQIIREFLEENEWALPFNVIPDF